jgi:hypothetical protein
MKNIVFTVNEKKSYIKSLGWPDVKPNVKLPLIVPLSPGGTIKLTIDENKHIAWGAGSDLRFITDQFEKNPALSITGNLQPFSVRLQYLDLDFDPKTGQILEGEGYTYVMGEHEGGGAGALALTHLGPSSLLDGNSPSFDIADGLGCRGGLTLEMGSGNPTDFIIHIEAMVAMEDADGDGKFERVCPSATGVQVMVGDFTEIVYVLFGVTNDGGGIGILPNGRIIRIPPLGPPDPILKQIAEGLSEVVRGLALRNIARDSSNGTTREAIERLSLEMAEKGLERTLAAVRKELADHGTDE